MYLSLIILSHLNYSRLMQPTYRYFYIYKSFFRQMFIHFLKILHKILAPICVSLLPFYDNPLERCYLRLYLGLCEHSIMISGDSFQITTGADLCNRFKSIHYQQPIRSLDSWLINPLWEYARKKQKKPCRTVPLSLLSNFSIVFILFHTIFSIETLVECYSMF